MDPLVEGVYHHSIMHSQGFRESVWAGLERGCRTKLRGVCDPRDQDVHVFDRRARGLRIIVEVR